jgi:uncharacterized protein YciI
MKKITLLSLILIPFLIKAQEASQKPLNETMEMNTYYLVFKKKGPNRNQDSITAEKIQKEHLLYLTKLYNEGHAYLIGPLTDDGEIRGVSVFGTSTAEEAKRLAEQDPAVIAGRLIVEVHPWYTIKGGRLK